MDFALIQELDRAQHATTATTDTTTALAATTSASTKIQQRPFQEGDLVVVMERRDTYSPIYLEKGGIFQNRLGHFHHDDIIGRCVGTKVLSRSQSGRYIRLLLPSPELWTMGLRQRTQIVQDLDQSMVVFMLGLRPGMRVLESGTGTGAMSHALLRAISPTGHLETIEFHATRAMQARQDFERNHLGHLVTVRHADICQELGALDGERPVEETKVGGGAQKKEEEEADEEEDEEEEDVPDAAEAPSSANLTPLIRELRGQMDAVFLDVPKPWAAIALAAAVLKPNASIATYSPCLEQVFKTCEALRAHNFHSIRTMEVRHKQFDVWRVGMPCMDFGDEKEKEEEEVGEEGKEKEENGGGHKEKKKGNRGNKRKRGADKGEEKMVAKPRQLMRGHTAFLTFAMTGLGRPSAGETKEKRAVGGEEREEEAAEMAAEA